MTTTTNTNELYYFTFERDDRNSLPFITDHYIYQGFLTEQAAACLWAGFSMMHSVTVMKNGEIWK